MIYLIITTSINNKIGINNSDHRKQRYTDSINAVLAFVKDDPNIKPIIVENNGPRKTYLDDFGCDVVYTNNNTQRFTHKGVNELLDINEVGRQYNIQNDDYIIKLTGRYRLLNSSFIDQVKRGIDTNEAFVKFFNVCTLQYMFDDCVLGLFAVKAKYLRMFGYSCVRSPECEFADHLRKHVDPLKIAEIQDLGLECCFADDLRLLLV
jgi:hypothetical protein